MRKLAAILALLLFATGAYAAILLGPMTTSSPQNGGSGVAPVVQSNPCTIALPVINGTNTSLIPGSGGACAYTANCNGTACSGTNAITGWAVTAQSTANAFAVVSVGQQTNPGVLQGSTAASSVTAGSYTVTVTATNSTGTSPGVVQNITVANTIPAVASHPCTIAAPVTNGVNVSPNCSYTATCDTYTCVSPYAITSWAITSQSCASCFSITNAGVLQGGVNAANAGNSATVTVTATNAVGTSTGVTQSITIVQVPVVQAKTCTISSPLTNGSNVVQTQGAGNCTYTALCGGGTCSGSSAITGWAVTAQSCASCYSITSGGIVQGGALGANVGTETDTVKVTATNSLGTSAAFTQTINAYADGSINAPGDTGNANYTYFANPNSIATPQANPLSNASYAARPPWNVAGPDYPAGIRPAYLPLKTDILTNPPACASISGSSGNHQLNINSNNCTIQGYDLSVDGGVNIWVPSASTTGVLLSDNYFKAVSNATDAIDCNNAGVTIQYVAYNGNNVATSTAAQINRCWKVSYSYMYNSEQDMYNYGEGQPGTSATTQGLFVQFSAHIDVGYGGGHADFYQAGGPPGGGLPWNANSEFSFWFETGGAITTEGTQGWIMTGESNPPITGSFNYNTVIAFKTNGGGTPLSQFAGIANGGSDGTVVSPGSAVQNNFIDPTGMTGSIYLSGGCTLVQINKNTNMLTGAQDAANGWTHCP